MKNENNVPSQQPFAITVIKRDGRAVPFEESKIWAAIDKAREATGVAKNPPVGDDAALSITKQGIIKDIYNLLDSDKTVSTKVIELEKIQEIVESNLWKYYYADVARDYTTYRYKRTLERQGNIFTKYKKRVAASDIENSNANVDEASFSGREKEAASDVSKDIALNTDVLSKPVAQAHKEMLIYQHDLEKAPFGQHNCSFPRFDKLLKEGFKTRNGDVRAANSVQCACQLIAVITQCQSQVQFGGAGALHLDYDLAPYVVKSFFKHLDTGITWLYERKGNGLLKKIAAKKARKYIKHNRKIKNTIVNDYLAKIVPNAYDYAMEELDKEGTQAFESLYHNLNTLESRQGSQVPFSSINLGKDTTPEGRLISKWTFKASLSGIGEHHVTSIFPISIFSYKKGVNADKGDPNYDLKRLALESLSKRIYPNFANCDWSGAHEDPNDRDTDFGTMG